MPLMLVAAALISFDVSVNCANKVLYLFAGMRQIAASVFQVVERVIDQSFDIVIGKYFVDIFDQCGDATGKLRQAGKERINVR